MSKMGNFINFCFHRSCALFLILSFGTVCSLPASVGSKTIQDGVLPHDSFVTLNFMWVVEALDMWVVETLESFDENTTADEMVRFMAKVKVDVEKVSGVPFSIENLLYDCKETMEANGVEFDWDHFDDFVAHVQEAELFLIQKENNDGLVSTREPTPRPDSFLDNASNQEIYGFLECFCGKLLCMIPSVITLMGSGANSGRCAKTP